MLTFPSDAQSGDQETSEDDIEDDLIVHNEFDSNLDRTARQLKGQEEISPTPDEVFNAFDAALDQFADVMIKYQDAISNDMFNTCAKFQQDIDTLLMSGLYMEMPTNDFR